jgi:hypothetical protein
MNNIRPKRILKEISETGYGIRKSYTELDISARGTNMIISVARSVKKFPFVTDVR